MKVNEIVNESLMGAIGNAATGLLRMVDRAAGGSGDVGTASQRAAYQQKLEKKAEKRMDQINARLGSNATDLFMQELRRQGIDVAKLDEADPEYITHLLDAFTMNFFGSDDDSTIRSYVQAGLKSGELRMPSTFNLTTVRQYLDSANDIRNYVLKNVLKLTARRNIEADRDRERREAEVDISKTLSPTTQYRFLHPEYPGVEIIIRNSGYYLNRLPRSLTGMVKKDKDTGLYPVLRPENIRAINSYYNDAADMGRVVEEPVFAL